MEVLNGKHGKFTEEFKRQAVLAAGRPEVSRSGIARELGVNESLIRRWAREEGKDGLNSHAGKGIRSAESMGLERLRRELNRVRMERDALKKALGCFARDPA
ncbi:MAG: transposase [Pseudomonadota bacterium]|nr:transposase [Pseudomonadota bacterium]